MLISATAGSIRNALGAARRAGGLDPRATPEELRSGGEDGCWRVHLAGGHIVEVLVTGHPVGPAKAEVLSHG